VDRIGVFFTPRVNVIESDEGFSVEVLGPTRVLYVEGPRSVQIESEYLMSPRALVIYPSSIKRWDPPHATGAIDKATRDRIVENIRRAFRFDGHEIAVDW
jgi:hypothetical protein